MNEIEHLNTYLDALNAGHAPEVTPITDAGAAMLLRQARRLKVAADWERIAPDPAFVATLERQLLAHPAYAPKNGRALRGWFRWPALRLGRRRVPRLAWTPARAALLVFVLVLALALAVIGPQRVRAALQHLLSYIPGIGFVEVQQTRVLAAAQDVTLQGITAHLEAVTADQERTQVTVDLSGLPPETPEQMAAMHLIATLQLPGGMALASLSALQGREEDRLRASFEFPPLPPDLQSAILVLNGESGQEWRLSFSLRGVGEETGSVPFPPPYAPEHALANSSGVTLTVTGVAQIADETAVQCEIAWSEPCWRFSRLVPQQSALLDDLGHVYSERPWRNTDLPSVTSRLERARCHRGRLLDPDAPQEPGLLEGVLRFVPTSPSASRFTLAVDGMLFDTSTYAEFDVDQGPDPQVGDAWPLDTWLELNGFRLHLQNAQLRQRRVGPPDAPDPQWRFVLEFEAEAPANPDGSQIRMAHFSSPDSSYSGVSLGEPGSNGKLIIQSEFDRLPRGRLQMTVEDITILAPGPWQVSWPVPGLPKGADSAAL